MQLSPFHKSLWELPESPDLGVRSLAAVFRHTTNSYKFYWFLAILEALKNNLHRVSLDFLTAEMIAQVWYPVHMFKLNLGAIDQLGQLAHQLKIKRQLGTHPKHEVLWQEAIQLLHRDAEFQSSFQQLQRFVPQRFLTPWFSAELRGLPDYAKDKRIVELADQAFGLPETPLYRLVPGPQGDTLLELHPDWIVYLTTNYRVVRDFVLWNLSEYLYTRNPSVPNIPEKLFPPQTRTLNQPRKYWQKILDRQPFYCPYSQTPLDAGQFSLDHVIPWSFVCHDQLWNLVPVPKSVNSAKSDALPNLQRYLEAVIRLQYQGVQQVLKAEKNPAKHLEDYILLFRCDLPTLVQMPEARFAQHLRDTLTPLEQIAANMGFVRGWEWR